MVVKDNKSAYAKIYSNAACFSSGLYLKHTGACSGPQVGSVFILFMYMGRLSMQIIAKILKKLRYNKLQKSGTENEIMNICQQLGPFLTQHPGLGFCLVDESL